MRWIGAVLMSCALLVAGGCQREPAPPRAAATAPVAPPVLEVHLTPLTPQLPNRATHLAVDHRGSLFWVQESDSGDDTVFVIDQGQIPSATQLSAGNIAAALGAADPARGNIQGIAAGADGEIYFYFRGTAARQPIEALGSFQPRTSAIRILADSAALETATGMGKSLFLATGSVLSDGRTVWLWIRHSDGWCVFRFDPRLLPPTGPIKLTRAFTTVRAGAESIALTGDRYRLSPGADSSLLLLDIQGARLLRIAPDGTATSLLSLLGLPSVLSPARVDDQGRLILFAASADTQPPALDDSRKVWNVGVPWPAMLMFQGDAVTAIGRDNIQAYPGFPVFGLKVQEIVPGNVAKSWVIYDSNSGEVMRATVRERAWP